MTVQKLAPVILACLLAASVAGQDAPKSENVVALRGAKVYTMEGAPIERGTILLKDGKVVAVGKVEDVAVPPEAVVHDLAGRVVVPGLIDAGSFALTALSDRGIGGQPNFLVIDALEPFNRYVAEPLSGGVTVVALQPDTGGAARGIGAVARVPAATGERPAVLVEQSGLFLSFSTGDPDVVAALPVLDQGRAFKGELEGAKEYIKAWEKYWTDLADYEKKKKEWDAAEKKKKEEEEKKKKEGDKKPAGGLKIPWFGGGKKPEKPAEAPQAQPKEEPKPPQKPPKPPRDRRREAFARLFAEGKTVGAEGLAKLRLFIEANTQAEIRAALKLKEDFQLPDVVLVGAIEAHAEVDAIAKAKLPVIYGPAIVPAVGRARYARRSTATPARLAAAGVKVALGTLPSRAAGYAPGEHDPSRFLLMYAAEAVAGGLDRAAALKAVTCDAAEIYGLKDKLGSIAAGREGDVVVLSGEPFDVGSEVMMTFAQGKKVFAKP